VSKEMNLDQDFPPIPHSALPTSSPTEVTVNPVRRRNKAAKERRVAACTTQYSPFTSMESARGVSRPIQSPSNVDKPRREASEGLSSWAQIAASNSTKRLPAQQNTRLLPTAAPDSTIPSPRYQLINFFSPDFIDGSLPESLSMSNEISFDRDPFPTISQSMHGQRASSPTTTTASSEWWHNAAPAFTPDLNDESEFPSLPVETVDLRPQGVWSSKRWNSKNSHMRQ